MKQRRFRITASRAYALFTYKGSDWTSKCQKYLMNVPFNNKYTQHGIDWEPEARSVYSREKKCCVVETGLVVCQSDPWLAVSPDGVILENGEPVRLLEIKCPFIGQTVSADKIEDHWQYLKREKGQLVLKESNKYYAQVQLNMAVLNLENCDFVIFSSLDKSFKTVNVPFNEEFTRKLLVKLKIIYFRHMLHTLCTLKL
ncbi:uncharacterized protein LOC123312774 isoform X2 [Coccinella septempunctata]|uniref:uncharacterized protein LOC123306866 isoform X2 n=1 Tax=Coccinella septempunctata TaxID=41139 RepID=UPI001D081C4F|nr:uncharacterized protein LOC123306866 isoform X2 [Coccinella septempunctata]XP_044753195.1 uncharacterized protein LOC123312774 isoform X2 [Coccinella septempunctata]